MLIHKMRLDEYMAVLDVNSGAVHLVDDVIYDLLDVFDGTNDDEAIAALQTSYPEKDLREALEELHQLQAEGLLFSPEFEVPQTFAETPILKSLCLHIAHDCIRVPFYLSICHHKQGIGAPGKGGTGAQCYQSIHIGRTVEQTLKATDKEFLVDDHDRNGKQELYQSHCDVISFKEFRQRPSPHHMAHGEIHERNQKKNGAQQTAFHDRCFLVFQHLFVFCCGSRL